MKQEQQLELSHLLLCRKETFLRHNDYFCGAWSCNLKLKFVMNLNFSLIITIFREAKKKSQILL
jgi:hypothetical protein